VLADGTVEAYVNEALAKESDMVVEEMPKEEAQTLGVEGSFWEKYPDTVQVYTVRAEDGTVYSRELCGGPHVSNTREIRGTFKIVKEEAISAAEQSIELAKGTAAEKEYKRSGEKIIKAVSKK